MQKIAIVGCGGSGKSHLAKRLGEALSLPVHHLDRLYWQPNWQPSDRDSFIAAQKRILGEDRWIIDGNYGGTMEVRLAAADTIVLLDLPTLACLRGVLVRYLHYRKRDRPDMAPGNPERLDPTFLRWVLTYRRRRRPQLMSRLKALAETKRVVLLHSRRETDRFVASVSRAPRQAVQAKP